MALINFIFLLFRKNLWYDEALILYIYDYKIKFSKACWAGLYVSYLKNLKLPSFLSKEILLVCYFLLINDHKIYFGPFTNRWTNVKYCWLLLNNFNKNLEECKALHYSTFVFSELNSLHKNY